MGHSYSFLDVQASIYGPGGNVSLAGDEAGVEQGGITVTPAGERSKMTVGADGSVMHSLLGDKSGTVSVKLLKTSSVNAALQIMYNLQTTTGAQHGMNTIVIRDVARGDVITCQNCAFAKQPPHHLRHRCRGCGVDVQRRVHFLPAGDVAMQFTIKDKTFDSGRLNAFQQLHVVRRLAPVTERLVALAGSAGRPRSLPRPAGPHRGRAARRRCGLHSERLPRRDADPAGYGGFARLRVNGVIMFPLDLTMLLGIAAHVLKDNLSGFFADLPSVLNRAGKAAESDG